MAGMTCHKPGERSWMFYAVREYNGRKDQPKGFGWRDFRDLLIRARIQRGGPIVLVWDNVRIHLTAPLREFTQPTPTGSLYSSCPPMRRISTRRRASGRWSSATLATSPPPTWARSPGL